MADKSAEIDNLRTRIKAGGAANYFDSEDSDDRMISEDDQALLIEFSDKLRLLRTDYSDARHQKLLNSLVIMAEEVGGLAQALEDQEVAEEIVRWINKTYPNEETNRDYRVALRVFGYRLETNDVETDDEGYPLSIKWISSNTSSTYDPSPEPGDMLRWEEDVLPMIDETRNPRDAAMIALAFDAGPRGGEFHNLRVGDITDGEFGMRVTLRGKQGKRTIDIIPSVPFVKKWLTDHPDQQNADAFLWSHLTKSKQISHRLMLDIFRTAADRVGVEKTVTPTNFRKSSAAHLASKGMNQATLEWHHGWVTGSKAAARYISIFADDARRELARIYGKSVPESDSDEIAPLECPRCEKETPLDKELCIWCGQPLEKGASQRAEQIDDALVQAIAQAGQENAEDLVEFRRRVKRDNELMAEMIDEIAPFLEG